MELKGGSHMIYRFFEKYTPEKGFQESEINLKDRSIAELHYIYRKSELSKTCFSIGKSTMSICCIEISEKTGNWLAVMYDHYLYGLIWIDLFTPTKENIT